MKFEEEFPSLCHWKKKKEKAIGPISDPEHMKGHIYYWNEIKSVCLDKQRVKEIIDRMIKEQRKYIKKAFPECTKEGLDLQSSDLKELKKELGLDK